jgi:phosphoenolpyruvate carboxylase
VVEIVLTAHPTQVNRRTLQYKHSKIAALLQQHDRSDQIRQQQQQQQLFVLGGDIHLTTAAPCSSSVMQQQAVQGC